MAEAKEDERFKLKNVRLGKSGLQVSQLALGPHSSALMGDSHFVDLCNAYTAVGGNHFDLSDAYTGSHSTFGKWLASDRSPPRDDIVIATKTGFPVGPGPNDSGLSRKHIMQSVHTALEELGTDYVDIFYCHAFDYATPLQETMSTLNDLKRAGKIHYIGVSNFTGWQIQKAHDISIFTMNEPVSVLQTQYNLLDRYPEWEQIPVCLTEGMGMMAWGPLGAGWLTGKYTRDASQQPGEGTRAGLEVKFGMAHNSYAFRDNQRTWRTLDALKEVAAETGASMATVATAWLLSRPGLTSPIAGARTPKQLEDSIAAAQMELTEEQLGKALRWLCQASPQFPRHLP